MIVPTIHFVFFFVPFASALLTIAINFFICKQCKTSIFELCQWLRPTFSWVLNPFLLHLDSYTQLIVCSSLILFIVVISLLAIKSPKISKLKFGKILRRPCFRAEKGISLHWRGQCSTDPCRQRQISQLDYGIISNCGKVPYWSIPDTVPTSIFQLQVVSDN